MYVYLIWVIYDFGFQFFTHLGMSETWRATGYHTFSVVSGWLFSYSKQPKDFLWDYHQSNIVLIYIVWKHAAFLNLRIHHRNQFNPWVLWTWWEFCAVLPPCRSSFNVAMFHSGLPNGLGVPNGTWYLDIMILNRILIDEWQMSQWRCISQDRGYSSKKTKRTLDKAHNFKLHLYFHGYFGQHSISSNRKQQKRLQSPGSPSQ